MNLTAEQNDMIKYALRGDNILVDACIGSGKTTTIQTLCNKIPETKKVLYLTYNKLLKEDARDRILNKNVTVTNYHGFAWMLLKQNGLSAGVSDMIQTVLKHNLSSPRYDIMIVDEYQDIDQEIAQLLEIIKRSTPKIQIIMVGDMAQKIYDKTTLQVMPFVDFFMGTYTKIAFTECFRLSNTYGAQFQRIWEKPIKGTNNDQKVKLMSVSKVINYLSDKNPGDILCLGMRSGNMAVVLNELEKLYPKKFNKYTVYASIKDGEQLAKPGKDTAIFTTYDSSKGLERKICVIFDFEYSYWNVRARNADANPAILRNIFCVAASRGKEEIIFVKPQIDERKAKDSKKVMKVSDIKKYYDNCEISTIRLPYNISTMFDFKYIEDIEELFGMISVKQLSVTDNSVIDIKALDGMIDLSPCIGIYQEASFFKNYDIDEAIKFAKKMNSAKAFQLNYVGETVEEKILSLTAFETGQIRYRNQIKPPFVSDAQKELIHERLSTVFDGNETVQGDCDIFAPGFEIKGKYDVYKNDMIYELKFVSELKHPHFLQLACYLCATGVDTGILWNIRDNTTFEVAIPNKNLFYKKMLKTITKRAF